MFGSLAVVCSHKRSIRHDMTQILECCQRADRSQVLCIQDGTVGGQTANS